MQRVPVLIVGGGVAGMAAAIVLARYGVECLLVERRPEPSPLPRATVVSTRSMELLRSWGLEREVLAGGVDAEMWLWECETLARASGGRAHPVGYPTRAQAAVVSPSAPAVVPQDWLEQVLRQRLAELGVARVELGTELVGLRRDDDGVRATLRGRDGERVVPARYLVGADGSHSAVREWLGVPMRRTGDEFSGTQVVFRAPLWPLLGTARYGLYVTTAEPRGVFLPAGRDDRWVYGFSAAPAAPPANLDKAYAADVIRRGAGVRDLPVRVERIGAFSSLGEVAERFHVGSVFLAGDAAHRVTPRGGTGMNTALHSGHDLGWKLAWVLRGWSAPDLLDSYETERRAAVEHNVARSTDPDGSRRRVEDELHVDLGGRVRHAWLPGTSTSTLDLLGHGWTLFTGPDGPVRTVPALPAPVTVCRLDAMTARAVGVAGGGALLARPDGVPAAA
jgi:2-polyprenyl-6-methoxyphenol hydroxylase-like FAD-dependent oxidoreductase